MFLYDPDRLYKLVLSYSEVDPCDLTHTPVNALLLAIVKPAGHLPLQVSKISFIAHKNSHANKKNIH